MYLVSLMYMYFLIIRPNCLPEFCRPFMPKIFFILIHEKSRITTKTFIMDVIIFKKVGTGIQTWGAFEPAPAVHHTPGRHLVAELI